MTCGERKKEKNASNAPYHEKRGSHRMIVLVLLTCATYINMFHCYGGLSDLLPTRSDNIQLASSTSNTAAAKCFDQNITNEDSTNHAIGNSNQSYTPGNLSPEFLMLRLVTEMLVLDEQLKHITANETAMEVIQKGKNPYLPYIGKQFSNFYIINDDIDDNSDDEIVMVSHISTNKLDRLLIAMKWWNGPISVAVLVTSLDQINQLVEFWKQLQSVDDKRPTHKLIFHVYLEARPILDSGLRKEIPYPHNKLRNQAFDYFYRQNNNDSMQNKKAQFFAAMDVDVLTSLNCHAELQQLVKDNIPPNNSETISDDPTTNSIRYELMYNKRVMVLPAFGQKRPRHQKSQAELEALLPVTRSEVREQYKTSQIECFHCNVFKRGQAATNFTRWMEWNESRYSSTADAIHKDPTRSDLWFPINYALKFEPYIVGYVPPISQNDEPTTSGGAVSNYALPKYFESFRGFGWDKLSWLWELHRAGFKYGTLQTAWAVHLYHPETSNEKQYYYNFKVIAPKFQKHLDAAYGKE